MEDTLSIILPVRDAQAEISRHVHHLLDLVPDLTSRFEIIVVDDASCDATVDIVSDLARQYPQVKFIGQKARGGLFSAGKAGLAAATGETIFVQEDMTRVSANDLQRLWSLRNDDGVVIARVEANPSRLGPELIDRLSTWGESLRRARQKIMPGGVQMIRRDEAQALAAIAFPRQSSKNTARLSR